MNELLLIASKVSKLADEIMQDDPTMPRPIAIQEAFKQFKEIKNATV